MTDLQWTFLILGVATLFAQRSASRSHGWKAWFGLGSFFAVIGLVLVLLDATGTNPNFLWIAAIPIAMAAVADEFHREATKR